MKVLLQPELQKRLLRGQRFSSSELLPDVTLDLDHT
jgi:hypothetical protein